MGWHLQESKPISNFGAGPSAEMCRGFLLYKFWRILPGIFVEDFSRHFPHKNEEKKSGEKIREKIRRPKKKIREKSVLPKTDPNNLTVRY